MNILGLTFLLICTPTALLDFAIPKWKADKNFAIEDAYKWTYQATRGGEHAAPDRDSAKKWLENEWLTMGDEPKGESEWVPLCPGSEIGRLNLRPFKARGGSQDDLVEAFLKSAGEYRSDPKTFTDAWGLLGKRLRRKSAGKVTHKEWLRLDAEMKKKDYAAVHHSDVYNKANRPAYRIITLKKYQWLTSSRQ